MSSLEDELLATFTEEIAREIDKEILETIMIDVLTDEGWTLTKINHIFGDVVSRNDWYSKTAEWIHLNAQGEYKLLNGQWLFENKKDATMFILRWTS